MWKKPIRASLLLASVVAAGGSASAAEIQRTTLQGSGVSVNYFGSAAITCADGSSGFISAFGALLGAESISTATGTPTVSSNAVFVQVDSYSNSCTGVMIAGANNTIENGFTPPEKKLTSSALAGTTVVTDFFSGAQITVSIAVDLTGDGQLTVNRARSRSHFRVVPGGAATVTMFRTANTSRNGIAEGTMTIDGVDISAQFMDASLFGNSSATRIVTR